MDLVFLKIFSILKLLDGAVLQLLIGPDQIDSLLLGPGRSNFYGLAKKIKSRH